MPVSSATADTNTYLSSCISNLQSAKGAIDTAVTHFNADNAIQCKAEAVACAAALAQYIQYFQALQQGVSDAIGQNP